MNAAMCLWPLIRFQFAERRLISAKTRYVADAPVRMRFAASVRRRTLANTDSIGLLVRMLFQFSLGKAKKENIRGRSSWTLAEARGYAVARDVAIANIRDSQSSFVLLYIASFKAVLTSSILLAETLSRTFSIL